MPFGFAAALLLPLPLALAMSASMGWRAIVLTGTAPVHLSTYADDVPARHGVAAWSPKPFSINRLRRNTPKENQLLRCVYRRLDIRLHKRYNN